MDCSRTGVKLLISEMIKSGIGRQEFASIALIKAYGEKSQPERAIHELKTVQNPSIHCYNAAISAVLASEEFGYAKSVMESISSKGTLMAQLLKSLSRYRENTYTQWDEFWFFFALAAEAGIHTAGLKVAAD